MTPAAPAALDPITLAVVKSALDSIVVESCDAAVVVVPPGAVVRRDALATLEITLP